jgi:hypothetical protein
MSLINIFFSLFQEKHEASLKLYEKDEIYGQPDSATKRDEVEN